MKIKCTLDFSRENPKSYGTTKNSKSSKMDTTSEFTMLEKPPSSTFCGILVTCHFLAFFNIYSCNIHFASVYFAEWLLIVEKWTNKLNKKTKIAEKVIFYTKRYPFEWRLWLNLLSSDKQWGFCPNIPILFLKNHSEFDKEGGKI